MVIQENAALLTSLISQLSAVDARSSFSLTGDVDDNLMGLWDLLALEMITGEFSYGRIVAKGFSHLIPGNSLRFFCTAARSMNERNRPHSTQSGHRRLWR
ncbi:hypothetical protein SAMN04489798_3398 [Pseudomonas arsenicoxydans]|uniref:Uncharacterized protein n=1 Tax=Pseudomonas arsenicoxydans TaxID=702115 RepID=A0A1H0KYA6_9PSED|nr:hypothetical protein SAMN04489798_3398 [Pseudomonas arsenicoxydans]